MDFKFRIPEGRQFHIRNLWRLGFEKLFEAISKIKKIMH